MLPSKRKHSVRRGVVSLLVATAVSASAHPCSASCELPTQPPSPSESTEKLRELRGWTISVHTLTLAAYAGAIVSRPKGKKAVAPWALLGVLAGVIHTARAVSFGLRCGDHERADVHKHGHWLGAALSFLGPAVIGLVTPRKGDSSWQLVPSFAPDERGAASASLHLLGRW